MDKEEFKIFVAKILDELRLYAEIHADQSISGDIEFKWLRENCKMVSGRKNAIDEIIRLVFVDKDLIYPCCNLDIMELTNEGNLRIEAWIANFKPGPFQNGWSGRPGPFIYSVYEKFTNSNIKSDSIKAKLVDLGLIVKSSDN